MVIVRRDYYSVYIGAFYFSGLAGLSLLRTYIGKPYRSREKKANEVYPSKIA